MGTGVGGGNPASVFYAEDHSMTDPMATIATELATLRAELAARTEERDALRVAVGERTYWTFAELFRMERAEIVDEDGLLTPLGRRALGYDA